MHYGAQFQFSITPGIGDGGIDFGVRGLTYGIQAFGYRTKGDLSKRLIVEKAKLEMPRTPDVFVGCVVHIPRRKVWVRGQVDVEVVRNREAIRLVDNPERRGPLTYVVENRELEEPDPPHIQREEVFTVPDKGVKWPDRHEDWHDWLMGEMQIE